MGIFFLMCAICSIAAAQSAPPRKDIPSIAKAANGSIVSIVMSDKGGKPVAQGSGFFVSKDGLVVTNYHVIAEGNSAVVKLPDGAFYMVDGVVASDKVRDIAVIKAHGQNFRALALGNSNRVQVGEEVVAIGNPLSLESTVSNGIVSAIREVKGEGGKFLQVTAPISPGSSGGPLFNMAGEVVGITTLYLKGGENLNFAIPINDAKRLLLTRAASLDNLPTGHESDDIDLSAGLVRPDAPSTTSGAGQVSIARKYYQQTFDAGAFSMSGKNSKFERPTQDYVCFNDDPSSEIFFTFIARGYDEKYAEAWSKYFNLVIHRKLSDAQNAEADSYYHQMELIEQTADYPYVRFFRNEEPDFKMLPSGAQKVYRDGGRSLYAEVFEKGVKVASHLYLRKDRAWWSSEALSRLSIEPSTMRYLRLQHGGVSNADWRVTTTESGHCEQISFESKR